MFDVLPGYNVRIRMEDFFVLLACVIWGVWVLRGKINLKEIPLFKPIVAYLIIGFLSTLSAIFITETVTRDSYQILKLYLHWARRIEYFSLFFIFYTAIYAKEQIKAYIGVLILAIIGVTTYGFGQKYLYWPAYSTMNREFAKGITLYLSEHARVLSTFGGHYDLAAYIMMTLTVVVVLAFVLKKWWLKAGLLMVGLAYYWLLILTASRTSFIGYLGAITIAFGLLAIKKGWLWGLTRYAAVMIVTMGIMLTVGPLSERFAHVIKLQDLKTNLNKAFLAPPAEGIALRDDIPLDKQLAIVATKSDTPPQPNKPSAADPNNASGSARPADVYVDPYANPNATASGDASGSAVVHADYSENALKYGLSTGIRLDALWPRAITAFQRNPFLGTGYSTLVKTAVWEQTTAESTDNDYLRLLGETGLFGFVSFLLIFAVSVWVLYRGFKVSKDPFYYGLFASGIGLSVGLMINALYIDIFESSKVAYSYWSLMGILLAVASLVLKSDKKSSH